MKLLFKLIILTCFLPILSLAMEIPKLDLVTCQVDKEDIKNFFSFSAWNDSNDKKFEEAVSPFLITLQQDNLAGKPGIASFYKIRISGLNKNGKTIPEFHRSLEQVSVNFTDQAISVGYAPYQVSRTTSEPFTLLIEKNKDGVASGLMAIVPLQTRSDSPMKQIKMPCQILKAPTAPIKISKEEVLKLDEKNQFEIIYNLPRLGLNLSAISASKTKKDEAALQAIGLTTEKLNKIKADISKYLASRKNIPLTDYEIEKKATVVIPQGDKCGNIELSYITPVYDSVTLQEYRKTKNIILKQKALGYHISKAKCELPARLITQMDFDDKPEERKNMWQASDLVINSEGVIGTSFKGSSIGYSY